MGLMRGFWDPGGKVLCADFIFFEQEIESKVTDNAKRIFIFLEIININASLIGMVGMKPHT
jgi:hypothetical protein